jgi:biofilm PGA synthesis N-glycosyltransferase PgaC
MVLVFWLSVALIAYVYVGYPATLYLWGRLPDRGFMRPRSHHQADPSDPQFVDGVSIVLAARNEASRLAARIDNLLSLDFPAAQRQIIVVSDGSTDGTLDVLSRYGDAVDVIAVPAGGKALALNAGVQRARFDVVVFADARQMFAADALRELVAPFADRRIGGVTGELLLDAEARSRRSNHDRRVWERRVGVRTAACDRRARERRLLPGSSIADGVGLYWRYEKQLRRLESRLGSTLGATGAIYAIRRALYQPLPADTILDDVLTPMRIVMAGYRVVFNDKARAFDRAADNADAEARRKIRTLAGNYQILALEPGLLVPWRNPVWVQYVSHKIGRLTVPYAMLAALASSIVLAGSSAEPRAGRLFYAVALGAQVLFFLLAAAGALLEFASQRRDLRRTAAAAPPRAAQPIGEVA